MRAAAAMGCLALLPLIPFPEFPELNYLPLTKTVLLLVHETIIVNGCGQTEAATYSTPGGKGEAE